MKILVITRYYPPIIGGISHSLRAFNDTFKKNKHKIAIFIFNKKIKPKLAFPKTIYRISDYRKYIKINIFSILKDIFYFLRKIFNLRCSFRKKITSSFKFIKEIKLLVEMINICQLIKYYDEYYNFEIAWAYE